jgi:(S)-2-hydroxyglutarate dehydrogenase
VRARYDVVVAGGGIIGLSTALAITERRPGSTVLVLEKEHDWAVHQTGHNSGVIHSGIYYTPGSLKARFAVEGARTMVEFCQRYGVAHQVTGKLVVAAVEGEVPRMRALAERGRRNGVPVREVRPEEIASYEPHVRGVAALHVPTTGICDFTAVTRTYAKLLAERGADLRTATTVLTAVERSGEVAVRTDAGDFFGKRLVNCTGLHSDRLARTVSGEQEARIIPFRGEYYELAPDKRDLVRGLVYPVPDPRFPFLGVHLTRGIRGDVHVGPNAVLALRREGYRWSDVSVRDLADVAAFPGLWRLARRHWRYGAGEVWRSLSKAAFTRAVRRLLPEVTEADLVRAPSGVRAQAVRRDGALVDDFLITGSARIVHVLNAPSPAATASLPIGAEIARRVLDDA